MDDPFDQLHGPNGLNDIPNVGIIDNDAAGPDNRGSDPAPGRYTATTDQNGEARVTITVSMQAGNNYRAAASCLEDVFDAADPQVGQADADALSTNGDYARYRVPAVWSPMLTVWRKLHVEVDSMGPSSVIR